MIKEKCDSWAYYRLFLGATVAHSLVPQVLKKIFSLEIVKNDICVVGASKQNALFFKTFTQKEHPCPQCLQ